MKHVDPIVLQAAVKAAEAYITDPRHAEHYLFPITIARHDGLKNSKGLALAQVDRADLLDAITSGRAIDTGYLQVKDGHLKVSKVSEQAIRKAFGSRAHIIRTQWAEHTYTDLPFDPSPCAGPRARTFEKRAAATVGAIWCGALHNVQVDGVVKTYDADGNEVKVRYECKGLGGRITAFVPSEFDKDGRE